MYKMNLTVTEMATKKVFTRTEESDKISDIKKPVIEEIRDLCKENGITGHIDVSYHITGDDEYYDSEETVFFVTKDYALAD